MLTALSIRDVLLIERLDLGFGPGLTVLTGETGAGKSILLDSFALALGARADQGLLRKGAGQASVTAAFAPPQGHPALAVLAEQGIAAEEEVVLRRVLGRDGRSRAFVNDQPVGAALLRRVGSLLVEVQGQHDQMGLADPTGHAALLDAFGVAPGLRDSVARSWRDWRAAAAALAAAREAMEAAQRDEDWLRHAVEELATLRPQPGEEEHLAAERQALQQGEKRAEAIAATLAELAPRDRRSPGPAAALRGAARALQRLLPATPSPDDPVAAALSALERAEEWLGEAETLLTRLAEAAEADPRRLEQAEERLFALRAAARKHQVAVADLPALLDTMSARLAALETGTARVEELAAASASARAAYIAACALLSAARRDASARLDQAVARELPPLRLDRARFVTAIGALEENAWGPAGADSVRFLIATNPGQEPGPLARVASGGELSRLMLALKVVLAGASPVPTLVFDEVDSGIGGATAAAVGERLARVAEQVQVLLVTHSPQVAARGAAHLRVAKLTAASRAETTVDRLDGTARREEIARMLAGETITEAARAAADSLLGALPRTRQGLCPWTPPGALPLDPLFNQTRDRQQPGQGAGIGLAIHRLRAPMALEGPQHRRQRRVQRALGRHLVADMRQRRPHIAQRRRIPHRAAGAEIGHILRPQPDPVARQPLPVEFLAGVVAPVRRHVAMADEIARRHLMARQDLQAQIAHRHQLQHRKVAVAEFMPRIDDLDADRPIVQPALAAPAGNPGMPGASPLRHQAQHIPVLVHQIVAGYLRRRIAQPLHRLARGLHAGVMQDHHVDRRTNRPVVLVRTGQVADRQGQRPRSLLILSQAALMRATLSLARAMNSAGTPRLARLSGWFSRISCFQVARTSSSLAPRCRPSTA